MYKILGGDGKEYGPVSAEALRQWVAEGRANAQTLVQVEGFPNWVPLGSLPDFLPVTGAVSAVVAQTLAPADAAAARDRALRLANPAGIALCVAGALGVLWVVAQAVMYAVNGTPNNPIVDKFLANSASPGAARLGMMLGMVISLALSAALAGFTSFAGLRLRQLRSWGVVLAAAILSMIPCCGASLPVCFVSLPVGIWVLVVITRAEVKPHFQ